MPRQLGISPIILIFDWLRIFCELVKIAAVHHVPRRKSVTRIMEAESLISAQSIRSSKLPSLHVSNYDWIEITLNATLLAGYKVRLGIHVTMLRKISVLVEQRGIEPLTSALRNGLSAKRKLLPFRKLQPPKKNRGFTVLYRSLPWPTRPELLFLSTYWPPGSGCKLAIA